VIGKIFGHNSWSILLNDFYFDGFFRLIELTSEAIDPFLKERGGFLPRMPDSLERLDLLLIHEVRTRKLRTDGIHFRNFRYLSLTLAAYVGEEVTIRFDPRDMGEIRVFYRDRFLCRAIPADLAAQTVPLRDIVNARKRRRTTANHR